jgi:hypothetical protein
MGIDGTVSQTAVEAWDKRWATREGRADWLVVPTGAARQSATRTPFGMLFTVEKPSLCDA